MQESGLKVIFSRVVAPGNATYIETPKQKILVDCGLTGKAISAQMEKIDRSISDVDAIFVTHEHSDHIKGIGVLAQKGMEFQFMPTKNMASNGWKDWESRSRTTEIFNTGDTLTFGDLDVMSFAVSHDAAAPQFYSFQREGKQFVMLTDTGYVSDKLRGLLKNADAYLIESNHDLEMLRMGPYVWHLKQRILSDKATYRMMMALCDV